MGATISCYSGFFFTQRILETVDLPKGFPLFTEVQWCEAAVVLLMEHPAPCFLQQGPAHLHSTPLGCNMKCCSPLLVNCIHSTPLKRWVETHSCENLVTSALGHLSQSRV